MPKPYDIALFGWYNNSNVGGSLNFLAVHETLKNAGFNVVVPSYKGGEVNGEAENLSVVKKFYQLSEYFDEKNLHRLSELADFFVVGSDQLWNASYSFDPDRLYLGCGDFSVKKISFATSFGQNSHSYDPQQLETVKKLFSLFNHISVREESGVQILKEFNINATAILEPVFLCNKSVFDKLRAKSEVKNKNSLVAYMLKVNEDLARLSVKFQNMLGLKSAIGTTTLGRDTFYVENNIKTWKSYEGIEFSENHQNVADFIANCQDADFIFTDSFHGICFALLYHKPFIAVRNTARGAARYDILDKLGLEDRILSMDELDRVNIDYLQKPICWENVDIKLSKLKSFAFEWLKNAFEGGNFQ